MNDDDDCDGCCHWQSWSSSTNGKSRPANIVSKIASGGSTYSDAYEGKSQEPVIGDKLSPGPEENVRRRDDSEGGIKSGSEGRDENDPDATSEKCRDDDDPEVDAFPENGLDEDDPEVDAPGPGTRLFIFFLSLFFLFELGI